jgi:hypothetical protein
VASFFARFRLGAFLAAAALTLLAGAAPAHAGKPKIEQLCPALGPGFAHCDAQSAVNPSSTVRPHTGPAGYWPSDLQDAYNLASQAAAAGGDQTVAIIDAYDNPNAEADLAVYRSQFGLPACTTANGCFRKVNQNGNASPLPAADAGWAGEIALDLDMVSAVCPQCKILLVEATTNSMSDLGTAVNRAATMGATQISNSYGGDEWSGEAFAESYYHHPGVAVTVSSGDYGYGVEYPAASAYVTAVGGTSLYQAANTRGWTEEAWDGAGSGCSTVIAKPAWQVGTKCTRRMVADVSAVADPNTGVAVYNTYFDGGWGVYGGTSAAAPIVAAAYALVGSDTGANYGAYAYGHTSLFNDVKSGSNGSCLVNYLCTATLGWDGPTGLGTPNLGGAGDAQNMVDEPSGTTSAPGSGGGTTTAPPPPVITPAPVRSSVSVRGGTVSVSRSGKLSVRISCGAAADCDGLLTLQYVPRRGVLLTLGRARFHVAAGTSRTVTITLPKSKQRTLAKARKMRAYGTAADSDGSTAQGSLTLTAPPKRRARRHH